MALDPQLLLDYRIPPVPVVIDERDALLYAVSLGLGQDPLDLRQLRYVYERDQAVFPIMPVVIGAAVPWMTDPAIGLNSSRLVHGEQSVRIHRPLRVGLEMHANNAVISVVDKGKDRGALIHAIRRFIDAEGNLVAEATSGYFFRGDGGFGGPVTPSAPEHAMPHRAPDSVREERVPMNAAILYRLNGDRNPLHIDPDAAHRGGFPQPILHGLCTFGLAARMVLDAACDLQPDTLAFFRARFSAPVGLGETLRTEVWQEADRVLFRTSVPERGQIVLSGGVAELN